MIVLFFSCGSAQDVTIEINGNTQTETQPEPTQEASSPSEPTSDPNLSSDDCDQAPAVTWNNWVQSMLITNCQGCHASESPNRYGAPIDIHFDHEGAALDLADRIYVRVLEKEDMPPAGGVLGDDLYLLDIWIRCSVGL